MYPQHPIPSQSWNPWREAKTPGYCFGYGEQGIGDGDALKENNHNTRDEIKDNTYICFIEALSGNYVKEQTIGKYEESDAHISVKGNLKKQLCFW